MRHYRFAAVAAALLAAACGKSGEAPKAESEQPRSLMEQVEYMAVEQQPVFAYQQLVAYQQAHPESLPRCAAPRATEARPIPDDVALDSFYAPYKGAAVFSIQCGEQVSRARMDPKEHWLVVFPPGAMEATIVSCADARGEDQCPLPIPRIAAAAPTP